MRYAKLYELVANEKVFNKAEVNTWLCRKCGFITESGLAPIKCPLCNHPQAYQELLCEIY